MVQKQLIQKILKHSFLGWMVLAAVLCLSFTGAFFNAFAQNSVDAVTQTENQQYCTLDLTQVNPNQEEIFSLAAHADDTEEDLGLPYLDLEIPMSDNMILYGKLYDPTQSHDEEAPVPTVTKKYPLVMLLHGLNGSHQDWHALPEHLVKAGYAVVAIDMRGHGDSTQKKTGGRMSWRIFKKNDWDQMPRDIDRVRRYIVKNEDEEFDHIDATHMALIGSKLGANAALISGDRDSDETIKAMVLISPGLNYKGLETSFAIVHYRNPIFILTSHEDLYAVESSELLYRWALGAKAIQMYKNVGDGTDMLRIEPKINDTIVKWLERHYPSVSTGH